MLRIDEAVAVLVDQEGSPVCFRWQEKDYLVGSRPVRWFARTQWWIGERAQRGIGSGALEVEMWRVISSELDSKCHFELIHNSEANSWKLLRRFD
jgi:hypothetical protein